MDDETALLAAVRANPTDLTPRLVYADWLDERGDPDRVRQAAYIRAECELLALPFADPACLPWFDRLIEIGATPGPVLGGWELAADMVRVRGKIDRLRSQDTQMVVWGARHHGYRSDPPLAEIDLLRFEWSLGFLLPADYRTHLLRIGNGPVGPDCGLYPLDPSKSYEVLRTPFPATDAEADAVRRWVNTWWGSGEVPDSMPGDLPRPWSYLDADPILVLCTDTLAEQALVVNGPQRGAIWHLWDWYFPHPHDGRPLGFLSWYEEWLDRSLARETPALEQQ